MSQSHPPAASRLTHREVSLQPASPSQLAATPHQDLGSTQGIRTRITRGTGPLALGPLARGVLAAGILGLGLTACSGSGSSSSDTGGLGTFVPDFFFEDVNSGGTATEFHLSSMTYGRLVNVEALDSDGAPQLMGRDFVIQQSLVSDDLRYELSLNGVTGVETLLIKRDADDPDGRLEFLELLESAGANLDPIQVQDLTTSGTYSMLPRNSALVMTFDDLVHPATVTGRTIQIVQGYPPISPFEARIFPSKYYGGTLTGGAFYSTRVIVDMTTSLIEKQSSGSTAQLNGVGLPASLDADTANVQVRIPTVTDPTTGLTRLLTNLTGHEMSTTNNGPVDFSNSTQSVTRAVRSGGRVGVVADPYNGFLLDTTPPQVVGSTPLDVIMAPVQVRADPEDTGSLRFTLPEVQLPSTLCGRDTLESGDVIAQNGLFAAIVKPADLTPAQALAYLPDQNGYVFNLPVDLVSFPPEWDGPADWQQFGAVSSSLEAIYELGDAVECYVQILPRPSGFPDSPTVGASRSSILSLRFSEPMDPASLTAFDSVTLARRVATMSEPLSTSDFVVGALNQSATLREVTFVPVLDLAHVQGSQEEYFLTLANADDAFPPRDLAGNPVGALPTMAVGLAADQPTFLNGGRVSRFSSTDEEAPIGFSEWGGQIQIDSTLEAVRPRPVIRSQVVIDNAEQALVAQMTAFLPGVVTPFAPLGAKMQTVWRYSDCGFSLTGSNTINIDVEGLWWAPAGGSILPDSFSGFEIRLSHSRWAPDETINPTSLFPRFQNSGLRAVFTNNVLAGENQQVVHSRERGYTVNPGDTRTTGNGTNLVPFPLNRDIADEDKRFFTWRDTRIRERTGQANGGLESEAYLAALGLPAPPDRFYRAGQFQTIGLPLLMEFRTSHDTSASGQNAWLLNLAVNSSSKPYFRAFSTGGVNTSGNSIFIDPGNESISNGGFSPGTTPPGGATYGRDNTFHLGALDYVARVSLSHSIWFESEIEGENPGSFQGRTYSEPTVEPGVEDQPLGTSVTFSYRGATEIVFENAIPINDGASDNFSGPADVAALNLPDYRYDAFTLDLYGDYYNDVDEVNTGGSPQHPGNVPTRLNFGLTFLPNGSELDAWRSSVNDIEDARYYQVRINFISNPTTGQSPDLSAFALTWTL